MNAKTKYLPWLMWLLPLLFFSYQFILRLFPGLIMPEMLKKYHITATDFGIFASVYYIGYASMQIPIAILLEKFGPKKIISFGALLCGSSVWILVFIPSWPVALLSRFLVGVGSVVGFLGTSAIISKWFSQKHYSKMVGFTFSFGLLGAIYGGKPVSLLITQLGWERVLILLGAAALLIGFAVMLVVKNKPQKVGLTLSNESSNITHSFIAILQNKSLLLLAIGNFLMVGALEGFADVWGVSFLMAAKGLTKSDAAGISSFIFVGMLFGGPILASFAEKYKAHYFVTASSGIFMALLLGSALLFHGVFSNWALCSIMFLIGILCCYQVIVFSIGATTSIKHVTLTIAFLNCINMLGGSFFHSLIGRLMDYLEPNSLVNGANQYSLETYSMALSIIPLCSVLGSLFVMASKLSKQSALESAPEQQVRSI